MSFWIGLVALIVCVLSAFMVEHSLRGGRNDQFIYWLGLATGSLLVMTYMWGVGE